MSLTVALFAVAGKDFSWRDVILIGGGIFLLVKATIEMHDRLEAGDRHGSTQKGGHARFWPIVAQIVVLDAVFSLDSVVTAISMVDEIGVMIAAVVVAMIVMLVASKPLTRFVNAHPTIVILCLGFLLMIGLVLVVDGLGHHIPKGYVYATIAFAIVIEAFNQLRARNRHKRDATLAPRQRVTNAVLRLLAGVPMEMDDRATPDPAPKAAPSQPTFGAEEMHMVRGVLALAARPVRAIMTPRGEVEWVDLNESPDAIVKRVRSGTHPHVIASRGEIDEVAGVVPKEDVLALFLDGRPGDIASILRTPVAVPERTSILSALRTFSTQPVEIVLVVDEFGGVEGIATQADFLRAIAGGLAQDASKAIEEQADGSLALDGALSIYDAQDRLALGELPSGDFTTLGGCLIALSGRIPETGDRIEQDGWSFDVIARDGLRISKVIARRPNGATTDR